MNTSIHRLISKSGNLIAIRTLAALAALVTSITPALGQILPPTPPKSPATPEYVPPAPPPPQATPTPARAPTAQTPAAAPEETKPLPTLIELDAAGKIKPLKYPVEEAAVRSLGIGSAAGTEEAKAKLDAAFAKRRLDVGRTIVEHMEPLMEVRKVLAEVTDTTSLDTMAKTATKVRPFRTNALLDFLVREGAVSPAQKTQATQVAREYKGKIREQAMNDSGGHGNMNAMALIGFKFTMDDFCGEAFRELDQLLQESTPTAEQTLRSLPGGAAAVDRLRDLIKPGSGTAKPDAVKTVFFELLSTQDKQAYLTTFKPELTPPPAPPAPATPPASPDTTVPAAAPAGSTPPAK